MASNFGRDRQKAKKAEHLVCEVLSNATIDYSIEDVADVPEYFYKGDIKVLGACNDEYYIDVKDDSRIAETGNVLCEAKVYSYREQRWLKGNMDSDYNALAVVAQQKKVIYIIDFDVLKRIYKSGKHYSKDHYDDYGRLLQKTVGTLCSLKSIERAGGLLYIIKYDDAHNPTDIKKIA